jgi:hypothetical protein
VTAAPPRVASRWARCGDVLSSSTTSGTVVLPADGRTAVTLSPAEQALWVAATEPATAESLASQSPLASRAGAAHADLVRMAGLGIVREVA